MDTLDYDYNVHQDDRGDASLFVKFSMDAMQDTKASAEAGRPIFKEVEFVEIRTPGSKDNVVVRPARDRDRQRFPRQYAMFRNQRDFSGGNGEQVAGTPLTQWGAVSKAQVEEFRYFNILTVEQLAATSDSLGQKFMGFQRFKQMAADFITAAKDSAVLAQMRDEIEALKASNKELVDELKAMREQSRRSHHNKG